MDDSQNGPKLPSSKSSTQDEDPLPELDGFPLEAKLFIKAAMFESGASPDSPALLKRILEKTSEGSLFFSAMKGLLMLFREIIC